MINDADIATKKTQLVIHRLSRNQYNELSSSPGKLKEHELYFVDDDNYDVFNKKIVNVGEPNPDSLTDGVNVGYVSTNYIKKNDIFNYVDKTALYTNDSSNSLSVDGCLYEKYILTDDWEVEVKTGSYSADLISVFYNGTPGESRTDYGWAFNVNNEFNIYTNNQDYNALKIEGEKEDPKLKVAATRPIHWKKTDEFVRKTDVYSCLSDINDSSTLPDVIEALKKLSDKSAI